MSNESVGIFNQPPLYQDPSCAGDRQEGKAKDLSDTVDYSNYFHVSIAWSLVEPPVKTTPTSALAMLTRLREIRIPFASVKVKIGNQIIDIPLLSQQMT